MLVFLSISNLEAQGLTQSDSLMEESDVPQTCVNELLQSFGLGKLDFSYVRLSLFFCFNCTRVVNGFTISSLVICVVSGFVAETKQQK